MSISIFNTNDIEGILPIALPTPPYKNQYMVEPGNQ